MLNVGAEHFERNMVECMQGVYVVKNVIFIICRIEKGYDQCHINV